MRFHELSTETRQRFTTDEPHRTILHSMTSLLMVIPCTNDLKSMI